MIVTCVHIHVKEEKLDQFIEATKENHYASIKEEGNLRFDVLQDQNNPCKFALYEAYISEDSAKAHKETEHYKKWKETVAEYMAYPREGIQYNVIEPKDLSLW